MTIYVLIHRSYDYHEFDNVVFATTNWNELMNKVTENKKLDFFFENTEEYSDDIHAELKANETPHFVIKEFK